MTELDQHPVSEEIVVDHLLVAEDIRKLTPRQQVPFLAAVTVSGLMLFPGNLDEALRLVAIRHPELTDNFQRLCLVFSRIPPFVLKDMVDQTADLAAQGVFPEGEGQQGWNSKEFDIAINVLGLTLNA